MMRFSMFSINKKRDKLFLLELAELIELLVRIGTKYNNPEAYDLAEKFGQNYVALEEKIKTHNYQPEDEAEEARKQRYNFKYND